MHPVERQLHSTKGKKIRSRRLFSRKRKFTAGLLAAICPGLGHIYLGLFRKGITFIIALLLDVSALLYFSSIGMQINVPLLIILGLTIPVVYFYNVYDVLQTADFVIIHRKHDVSKAEQKATMHDPFLLERGLFFGVMLIASGIALVLLYEKPPWLEFFFSHYGEVACAVIMLLVGSVWAVRETFLLYRKKHAVHLNTINRKHKLRVGRYTALLLLIAAGVLLLLDALNGTEHMMLLLKWWPWIAVAWGMEYIIMYIVLHKNEGAAWRSFHLDIGGMLLCVLLTASVFFVTQQEHYLHIWNKVSLNLTAAGVDYSEQEGKKEDKPMRVIPVTMETKDVTVDNINGDITLQRGPVQNIEVRTEVWVDQITGPEADEVANLSNVEVSEGTAISIQTKGKSYGQSGKRQPRMNLNIILPEDRRFNFSVSTLNGSIVLNKVEAIDSISLESANGELRLINVRGNIKGKTLNGLVQATSITGSIRLSTNRGNMEITDITEDSDISTQVGNVSVIRALGNIKASTKNGNIYVDGAHFDLNAESLNGGITAKSGVVGGNWDIYSAVGELNIDLPEIGNYELDGTISYGDIHNVFPEFIVDKKKISGQIGLPDYSVHVEGNSDLNVNKS
ncbi:DUF4097 family beta strand repeat-containing protein [Paenibacillus pini]|uniref:DUF4097 domain-containing protein n=1 Tax=Paenibacillus pini JCM 16418 TaxID=1236976 RepID=W7Z188_9BACL|nr:DUF4097 family beta strand repeat-containing protein [Paenibacillus pini]GAF10751.1 hypothetical protein JCM16418_4971 [Paenibacillus pini JCM 16418]